MKTQFMILCTIGVVSLGCLLWQRNEIEEIQKEIVKANDTIFRQGEIKPKKSIQSESLKSDEMTSREEKISVTVDQLLKLPLSLEKVESMADTVQAIDEILQFLIDQSGEELFLILAELKEREDEDALEILLMLLTDVEPERSLAFVGEYFSDNPSAALQLKMVALSALAGADPDRAADYIKSQIWDNEDMREMAERKVLENYAKKDLKRAFDYFESIKIHPGNRSGIIAQATQDSERREEAWELLAGDLDPKLRLDLNRGLLAAICLESGLAGVDEALPRLEFASIDSRDEILKSLGDIGFWNKPEETMSWIQREISDEKQGEVIPDSLLKWASRDYQAAGNWLREQEASAVKNAAVASYAKTIAKLNPQAALEWVGEISHAEMQVGTRREVLKIWYQAEPKAAQDWIADKGLDPKTWLSDD